MNSELREYLVEHRRVIPGKRELPLIEALPPVKARSAREAWELVRGLYTLTDVEDVLHVRRAA